MLYPLYLFLYSVNSDSCVHRYLFLYTINSDSYLHYISFYTPSIAIPVSTDISSYTSITIPVSTDISFYTPSIAIPISADISFYTSITIPVSTDSDSYTSIDSEFLSPPISLPLLHRYLFLYSINSDSYLHYISFSTPSIAIPVSTDNSFYTPSIAIPVSTYPSFPSSQIPVSRPRTLCLSTNVQALHDPIL